MVTASGFYFLHKAPAETGPGCSSQLVLLRSCLCVLLPSSYRCGHHCLATEGTGWQRGKFSISGSPCSTSTAASYLSRQIKKNTFLCCLRDTKRDLRHSLVRAGDSSLGGCTGENSTSWRLGELGLASKTAPQTPMPVKTKEFFFF